MESNPSLRYLNKKNDDASLLHLRQHDFECSELELSAQWISNIELLTGWQTPLTQPKIAAVKKTKNKRSENNAWSERKTVPACQSEIWADSVEKYSYRYIPNNGCYRAMKAQLSQPKLAFSQRRPASPSSGVVYSNEHKKLQRQLTRELQREFESLLERNSECFRFRNSPPPESDCLEDEQDYRNLQAANAKRSSGDDQSRARIPLPEPETRTLEIQSAQAAVVGNLEDLIINKRSTTNLDKLKLRAETTDICTLQREKPINIKQERSPSKTLPVNPNRPQCGNMDEVEALARETFVSQRTVDKNRSKALRPIEKITPSLREVYDNSRAVQEMMKLNAVVKHPTHPNINISSMMSLTRRETESADRLSAESITASKQKHGGTIKNALNSNYKVTKLGETRQKYSTLNELDDDNSFEKFLPSISGKRITTKLGSLR